jgi:hypothetical protein
MTDAIEANSRPARQGELPRYEKKPFAIEWHFNAHPPAERTAASAPSASKVMSDRARERYNRSYEHR